MENMFECLVCGRLYNEPAEETLEIMTDKGLRVEEYQACPHCYSKQGHLGAGTVSMDEIAETLDGVDRFDLYEWCKNNRK